MGFMILQPEHFDLAHRLRFDDEFKGRIASLTARLTDLEDKRHLNPRLYLEQQDKLFFQIWKDCGRNSSLLMPCFFPRYPKDKPMSMMDRPFNMVLLYMLVYSTTVLRGSRQIGKALKKSAGILTPTGWTRMGDLKVGDLVIGRDGNPCKVRGVYDQGPRQTYRVTFTDGASVECDLDHNWVIKRAGCKNWKVETLRQIVERSGFDPTSDLAVRIPLCEPAKMKSVDHCLSPYMVGALLGDGCMTKRTVFFAGIDREIIDRMEAENEVTFVTSPSAAKSHFVKTRERSRKSFLRLELMRLGLHGLRSETKRIPEEYLCDSVENRWALLQGLMDTDGSIYGKCQIEFATSSPDLARDVVRLVQSLGGRAKVTTRDTGYLLADGTRKECKTGYRVFCTRLPGNPFHLQRKATRFYPTKYERTRVLARIELSDISECRCIEVDSPDHTYLTDHCIVTHNTTSIGTRQRLNAHLYANFGSLYIAPHMGPLETYGRKFVDIDRAFRYPVVSSKFKQNLYYREYPNRSKIEMLRIQSSATPARGKTADEALFDEAQLFDPGLETEVLEVLNDSQIKSIFYAGTSTTIETMLETRYQEGTQGVWQILKDDGSLINCGDPDDVIAHVGEYYLRDPKTGNQINPLRGYYKFENPGAFEKRIFSIHVPQIINPDIANNKLEWNGIYRTLLRDRKKFIQEKLGIPLAEANREVSENDLKRICTLPYSPDERKRLCREGFYRVIISGFDWGGSDYNAMTKTKISTTFHTIIGVAPDDRIHLLHAKPHSGMDYKVIMNLILADHFAYSAGAMASDFGGGQQYHSLLRSHPLVNAKRHIIFDYSGPDTAISQVMKSELPNAFMLNRTESITALFMAIVMADPLILSPSWDEMQEAWKHFLNLTRVLTEKGEGRRFRYNRHGSKSDDFVHSLNMAFSLLRLSSNQALLADPEARETVRGAVYAGEAQGFAVGDPFAAALSNYAREHDRFD